MPAAYTAHELARLLLTYPNYVVVMRKASFSGPTKMISTCSIDHIHEEIKIG